MAFEDALPSLCHRKSQIGIWYCHDHCCRKQETVITRPKPASSFAGEAEMEGNDNAEAPETIAADAGFPFADRVQAIEIADVLQWLRAGWQDLRTAGWISPAYGSIFLFAGFALTKGLVLLEMPYLILPMIGGFLLIAPVLTLGLYRISKDIEEGRRPSFWAALTAFRANPYHILTAGLLLMLFIMIWARINVILFALSFPYVSMSLDSLVSQLLTTQGFVFLGLATVVGFGFALLAFVTNVTALPMMLDSREDIFSAALVSAIAVFKNPRPMMVWAALIVFITGIGLVTAFLGLVITLPLIGHASWHAYRRLIRCDPAPE
ncbi:Cytochrome C oxidase subunit I [Azospirillaceae bacterium]